MKRLRRFHPSPALVVACIALALSTGGVGYAAFRLPVNSVGSAQIQNRSIQRIDLGRKTVGSLRGQRGPQGPQGLRGAQGAIGAQGLRGPQGDIGPSNAYYAHDDLLPSLPPGDYV